MKDNLLESYTEILQKKGFANLSTIQPDGSPQVTPVWFDHENGLIRINTAVDRIKDRNMRERPKVAISILDPDNPYKYISIRGVVQKRTEEGADDHINLLAKKYLDVDEYPYRSPDEIRVLYLIKPISVSGI
ncbi:MAG: PPOX class F420-dependent oxidoreductase [Candidatus Hodarchaeales archaeon]|jgi:PPOX class probable F420-dependent enzyme